MALTVVAIGVRLHDIGRESLWLDEAGRAAIAALPLGEIPSAVAVVELSPPLYHLLLHLWGRLAGDGDISLRLFSALMAIPTVPLAWALGRRVAGPAAGFVVATQAALNPFAVHYGQEAAMYALALPLGLATTLAAIGALGGGAQGSGAGGRGSGDPPPQRLAVPARGEGVASSRSPRAGSSEFRVPNSELADPQSAIRNPQSSVRWLVAYVGFGTLALYTHYYAAFLLASVGLVGMVYSLRARSEFRVPSSEGADPQSAIHNPQSAIPNPQSAIRNPQSAIPSAWRGWVLAHAVIGLLFLPWLPTLLAQTSLAASVADWRGVAPGDALAGWATSMVADGAPMPAGGAVAALVAGLALGVWRLRDEPVVVWLLLATLVFPLALATAAAGPLHAFRERGFLMLAGAPWVLLAAALAGRGAPMDRGAQGAMNRAATGAVGLLLVFGTVAGLVSHFGERKEDWRAAAVIVESGAGRTDPVFFVHFGAQLPFDRYFHGPQPRIGLPESFRWEEGYRARYQVQAADVERRLMSALVDERHAWAVLSHEQGRGGEHVLAALDRWGERAADHQLYGVRIVRFSPRPSDKAMGPSLAEPPTAWAGR